MVFFNDSKKESPISVAPDLLDLLTLTETTTFPLTNIPATTATKLS